MITKELLFYLYTPHTTFCKKLKQIDVLFTFTFYITLPYLTSIKHNARYPKACVVGVRKERGRELGREITREGGGR